ncbi:hypothetical protein IRJ41_006533 [Triplophysa rosa]|uniref:Uncharacterized protein n=1 Tax=Triplophysa rosa TaxID=992332 RepID=A0A9W7TNL9_TRIRA|nr:hypothetical protein IRJ41_006533 [Triplophysa rosa]
MRTDPADQHQPLSQHTDASDANTSICHYKYIATKATKPLSLYPLEQRSEAEGKTISVLYTQLASAQQCGIILDGRASRRYDSAELHRLMAQYWAINSELRSGAALHRSNPVELSCSFTVHREYAVVLQGGI